jgi:hypothetical protein
MSERFFGQEPIKKLSHGIDELTEMQRKFAMAYASGKSPTESAKLAGFRTPSVQGKQLLRKPHIRAAIEKMYCKNEAQADMSRQRVVDGILEAIDLARLAGDPNAMITGWRELGRMCGYYEPEQKKIEINVTGLGAVSQLENMSDAELMKLVIEGEVLDVGEQSLLEGPDEDDAAEG